MMRPLLLLLLLCMACAASAQDRDTPEILRILERQAAAWNRGDLEGYMKAGYWQDDSMIFVGRKGPTYGFKTALDNYRKGYPDTAAMGKLHFDILKVDRLSPEYAFVLGKWRVETAKAVMNGAFTLLFRKIKGQWRIIADHSSG